MCARICRIIGSEWGYLLCGRAGNVCVCGCVYAWLWRAMLVIPPLPPPPPKHLLQPYLHHVIRSRRRRPAVHVPHTCGGKRGGGGGGGGGVGLGVLRGSGGLQQRHSGSRGKARVCGLSAIASGREHVGAQVARGTRGMSYSVFTRCSTRGMGNGHMGNGRTTDTSFPLL